MPVDTYDMIELQTDGVFDETDLAYVVMFRSEKKVLPKSRCCLNVHGDGNITVMVPTWIVQNDGLECYEV